MKPLIISVCAFVVLASNFINPTRADAALAGDLNGDCQVNTIDLMLIYSRYGARYGSLRYVAAWDFNGNRQIDIGDLQYVAVRAGTHC